MNILAVDFCINPTILSLKYEIFSIFEILTLKNSTQMPDANSIKANENMYNNPTNMFNEGINDRESLMIFQTTPFNWSRYIPKTSGVILPTQLLFILSLENISTIINPFSKMVGEV